MKGTDIAILAGIGVVGYGLLQSDFFKGLGRVGTGVGDAVEGIGGGVAELSSAIGSVGTDVSELTSFVGEFGNWTAQQFTELQQNSLRENQQADVVDRASFDEIKQFLIDQQNIRDKDTSTTDTDQTLFTNDQSTLRSNRWETFKTDGQDKFLDLFIQDGNDTQNSNIPAPTGLVSFNPLASVANFIKNIGAPSITGAVVKEETPTTSPATSSMTKLIRKSSGGGGSSSSTSVTTTSRNKFLEVLGYTGQSTASGVKYTKPTFSWSSLLRK